MLILTAKPDNLIVYRNNITVEECELNNEDDIIDIFNNYNLVTVKESDIIADNNIIDSSITHIISIPFKYNITSANVIKIKDNYYDIIGIKNLDELDEYLILYCAKYKDNERI
jgi:head-tail adaptor